MPASFTLRRPILGAKFTESIGVTELAQRNDTSVSVPFHLAPLAIDRHLTTIRLESQQMPIVSGERSASELLANRLRPLDGVLDARFQPIDRVLDAGLMLKGEISPEDGLVEDDHCQVVF